VICEPLVKVGDIVKRYQKIAESKEFLSAPVHASISGKVVEIKKVPGILGKDVLSIIIESDGKDEDDLKENHEVEKLTKEELLAMIKESGIVGMGGATFPTHVKLNPFSEKKVDTIILNGCECEPWITADDRLMREHVNEMLKGLQIILKITGAEKAFVAIEKNKKEAIRLVKGSVKSEKKIKVVDLPTLYPQGAEKTLIKKIIGKEVPCKNVCVDIGVVVQNVATAKAIHDAVYLNKPLTERIVTVTGDVNEPKNIMARIGTPVKDLIEQAGGYKGEPKQIISGGPMMGICQSTDEVAITKGTSCILVQARIQEKKEEGCIRCGKCIEACPMKLMPTVIALYSEKGKYKEADHNYAMDCFECGACEYICPVNRPLLQLIKLAKAELKKR
jgi:electron transport complex protein RnfC